MRAGPTGLVTLCASDPLCPSEMVLSGVRALGPATKRRVAAGPWWFCLVLTCFRVRSAAHTLSEELRWSLSAVRGFDVECASNRFWFLAHVSVHPGELVHVRPVLSSFHVPSLPASPASLSICRRPEGGSQCPSPGTLAPTEEGAPWWCCLWPLWRPHPCCPLQLMCREGQSGSSCVPQSQWDLLEVRRPLVCGRDDDFG